MTSALINGEQRQAVLLDAEPLEDVVNFKYFGSMFVANGPFCFLSPEIVTFKGLSIPTQLVQNGSANFATLQDALTVS